MFGSGQLPDVPREEGHINPSPTPRHAPACVYCPLTARVPQVLLGDFGLAKQLQRTFEMASTPIGTPYYM